MPLIRIRPGPAAAHPRTYRHGAASGGRPLQHSTICQRAFPRFPGPSGVQSGVLLHPCTELSSISASVVTSLCRFEGIQTIFAVLCYLHRYESVDYRRGNGTKIPNKGVGPRNSPVYLQKCVAIVGHMAKSWPFSVRPSRSPSDAVP